MKQKAHDKPEPKSGADKEPSCHTVAQIPRAKARYPGELSPGPEGPGFHPKTDLKFPGAEVPFNYWWGFFRVA